MRGNSYLRIFAIVIGFVGVSLFCGTIRVYAAYDTFLKIEGLDAGSKDAGRSVDDKHKDWIVVTRVVSGDLNAEAMADREVAPPSKGAQPRDTESGMALGKRAHKPLVIVKEMDAASPKLYEAVTTGKHFPSALVETGERQYRLYDVVIASAEKSGGGKPTETLTLNFTKVEVVGQAQK
jgi:type VI secretion system Hcp family effector